MHNLLPHYGVYTALLIQIGILAFATPFKVLQVHTDKIIENEEHFLTLKRSTQATFYFLLGISQGIISTILLCIVVNYSV